MAFRRAQALGERPSQQEHSRNMAGIEMNFAVSPNPDAMIEETLVFASEAGMDDGDLRVLSILTTWLGIHSSVINFDRLTRCLSAHHSVRVRAYWSAIATWLGKDRRFSRLRKFYAGSPVELLPVGNAFQVQRSGEDERFVGTVLCVPSGVLRQREADVLPAKTMVQSHAGYRNRVLIGPTWRADVWTVLERSPTATASAAARHAGCSFATAWRVVQDFRLLGGSV